MDCPCNQPQPSCPMPGVIEVEKPIMFRLVKVPSSVGDETAFPPNPGRYRNVLLHYDINKHTYIYSSDGMPVLLTVEGGSGTTYYAGTGLELNDNTFSVDNTIATKSEIPTTFQTIFYMNASETGGTRHIYKKSDMTDPATSKDVFDANDKGQVILRISTSVTPEMYSDAYLQNAYSATGDYQLLFLDEKTYRSFDTSNLTDSTFIYSSRVLQDKLTAGSNVQINGATISATDTTYSDFTGATSLTAGAHGLVPAPATTDVDKYLKGDGTWSTVQTGATITTFHWGGSPNYSMYKDSGYTIAATYSDIAAAYADGLVYIADGEDETTYVMISDIPDANTITVTGIGLPGNDGGSNSYAFASSTWTKTATQFQTKLSAGTNITISGSTISATDTTYSDFVGATSGAAGTHGLVPAPASGDTDKYLKSDGSWATVSSYTLPAASANTLGGVKIGSNLSMDGNDVLSATDTTYTAGTNVSISSGNVISATDTTYSNFVGTDGTATGTAGLVPAPATTDAGKVLSASGAWTGLPEGIKTLTTADYNYPAGSPDRVALNYLPAGVYKIAPNTSYTTLGSDSTVYTPYTDVPSLAIVFPVSGSSSANDRVSIIYTDSNGYTKLAYAVRNDPGQPSSNYTGIILGRDSTVDGLTSSSPYRPLSANQGRVLNNNIGDLTTLTTTAKTSAVAAINELDSEMPVITMSSTDPGEGATLDANHFIAYYE